MLTTVQVKPKPDEEPIDIPHRNAPADHGDPLNSNETDDIPTINDVESLKKGIVKTSKNKAKAPYTILLVGETGVGKSSIMEFIANVLIGRDVDYYDFEILDLTNEQGGSDNQSQTNSARLYELRSNNGITVRILDTPGLADTRGTQQDELHKKSIATQIKEHIDSVTAILVLANGTIPRVNVGTDYALSTLSAVFPKSLAGNIAFMFTNVLTPLHWNFSGDTIPDVLKDAPQFLLNNPIALQRKYLKLKDNPNMKKTKTELRKAVKAGEQNALETLVEFYDWLDSLEPQPTMEVFSLYEESQNTEDRSADPLAQVNQVAAKKAKNTAIRVPASEQKPASNRDYLCAVPNCSFTCSIQLSLVRALVAFLIPWTQLALCSRCAHPYLLHVHMSRSQSQRGLGHTGVDEPPHPAEDHAGPWPSGSFSARMEKAIRLLEHGQKEMEKKGVSREQLENMLRSLEQMKRRLDFLRKVKEKTRGGIRKVKQIFLRA